MIEYNDLLKFYINRNIASDSFELYLKRLDRGSGISIATNITFIKKPDSFVVPPLANLREEEAQNLLEELWKAGFRPKEVGTAGQLDSVKYHLEDMRKLVFK